MPFTTRSRFWGPLFPDVWGVAGKTFWGPLFPDPGPVIQTVPGVGLAGAATFVIDLDGPLEMNLEWQTDVFKSYDGQEKRTALLDHPRRKFSGSGLLIGTATRALRSQLTRAAAQGRPFLLGLPFESATLTASSSGTTAFVSSAAVTNGDWINPGQRVVVMGTDRTAVNAVIQSVAGTSVVLDIAPGAIGKAGGVIMPAVPVFLDPQQGFARYVNPQGFERWSIRAITPAFGFQAAGLHARAVLEDAALAGGGGTGALADAFVRVKVGGVAGNSHTLTFVADAVSPNESLVTVGTATTLRFHAGVTTMAKVIALFGGSAVLEIYGDPNIAAILGVNDVFTNWPFSGGTDSTFGEDGKGAVVVTHATRPVFDRRLVNADTIGDSMQAMNEIVDLGGIPANIGQASQSDWGRQITMYAKQGTEWQWIKKFLATVRGRQRAFWLATWRADLRPISSGANTLTIGGDTDTDGGFFSWYPARSAIQIVQQDGTITRATITATTTNGDGSITLTIGVTLSGSPIAMVSWLELCRFETDEVAVTFEGHTFSMETTARVVTR